MSKLGQKPVTFDRLHPPGVSEGAGEMCICSSSVHVDQHCEEQVSWLLELSWWMLATEPVVSILPEWLSLQNMKTSSFVET